MAKKQGSNIFIAHIEKAVLVLGLIVFGWVVFTRFVNPPGVDLGDGVYPASEVAKKGLNLAESIKDRMSVQSDESVKQYVPQAKNFGITKPFELEAVDTFPLTPIYLVDMEVEEDLLYVIPEIPELASPKVELFRGQAWVMVSDSEGDGQDAEAVGDVDFVTVEAVIPFSEIRDRFKKHFAGSQVQKPLEWFEPVVASVRLERSRLFDDGQWSEWESVERLDADEMKGKDLPADMIGMSHAGYSVLMESRREPYFQSLVLEPQPFELVDEGPWLSPTAKEKQAKEDRLQPKEKGSKGLRRTAKKRAPSRQPAGGGGMMPGAMMPGAMPGAMMPGMMPGAGGPRQGTRSGRKASSRQSQPQDTSAMDEWLEKDELIFWAHDDQVEPGGTYRYQIQVGFFNPIATHNWFTAEQEYLKGEMLLWSPALDVEKVVIVPERTLFFPRIAGRAEDRTVEIEVCRWQDGLWHKKRFRHLTAGSGIGYLEKSVHSNENGDTKSEDPQDVDVDYSTNMTILDILPGSQHWCKVGRSVRPVVTTDILYLNREGETKRLGVDKRTWPDGLSKKLSAINKAIREQEKQVSARR